MSVTILYINHFSQISGAEKVLINILTNLNRKRFIPLVACPSNGSLIEELNRLSIRIHSIKINTLKRAFNPFSLIPFVFYALITTIKLTYLIKSRNVKLIHANSFTACLFCSVAGKITGVPILWYMHDLVTLRLFNKIFIGYAGLMADRIVVTTKIMKNNLIQLGVNPKKIVVNYLGIDLRKYNSAHRKNFREEYNIAKSTPLIGIIGQLTAWKGHRDFLRAASIVAKKHPAATLLIVGKTIIGDKNYEMELNKLANVLNLSDKIIFTGFREDIPDVMSSLDILVNASWSEPFGLTIIEAMALGKPVIATNAGGVPEIIEDGVNGILVLPKDPQKLGEAIVKVLDNPRLGRKLGKAGQNVVKKRFPLERQIKEIEGIYEQILGKD